MRRGSLLLVFLLSSSSLFSFDFGSLAKEALGSVSDVKTTSVKNSLSSATVSDGLKEALNIGAKYAVKELGKKDGYLKSKDAKIPLPKNIKKAEDIIRGLGGDRYVDDL